MGKRPILRPILIATAVCGVLDILLAMGLTVWRGREIPAMLRFVASGPFPPATDWGAGGAALGLAVHFTLMAIMVGVFVFILRERPKLLDRAVLWGAVYGFLTYIVLDLIVVPLRFEGAFPPSALSIVTQLFAHVVLVGIVTALIARKYLRS